MSRRFSSPGRMKSGKHDAVPNPTLMKDSSGGWRMRRAWPARLCRTEAMICSAHIAMNARALKETMPAGIQHESAAGSSRRSILHDERARAVRADRDGRAFAGVRDEWAVQHEPRSVHNKLPGERPPHDPPGATARCDVCMSWIAECGGTKPGDHDQKRKSGQL